MGFPVLEEAARRNQLLGKNELQNSFALRPIREDDSGIYDEKIDSLLSPERVLEKRGKTDFRLLPLLSTSIYNSNRPWGWGNSALVNGAGFQNRFSAGVFAKFFILEIQLRPEFIYGENRPFQGYRDSFSGDINFSRFRFWNFGDHPEYFGEFRSTAVLLGQSYVSLNAGPVEVGMSTQNIWWGPGQFTSLLFSDNAEGIPHAFIRTSRPLNIGIGHIEGQLLSGRAEDSGLMPSQNEALNSAFFLPFSGDWRYINALSVTFQPSFLKNFYVGFNRVFQQYHKNVEPTFAGYFPVFEVFQKEKLFENGNSVVYDSQAQDQLLSFFFRVKNVPGKFEAYLEYGKHDHNFNWREFILNPEHARAYLLGFTKLFSLPKKERYIQIRAEMVQQSESINRYIRYPVLGILNTSWQTHYQVRGFTNYGESIGAGVGVGANAQILEVAKIEGLNKLGIFLQRIENHQDFFYRAFEQDDTRRPWIDLSMGLLWDKKWDHLILSTSSQLIYAQNYQWGTTAGGTADFPAGSSRFSWSGGIHLIYLPSANKP